MSISRTLADRQAFDQFTVAHPELGSARQITALTEEDFVQQYASEFLEGAFQARRVYQFAKEIHQHTALLWANLKDIASPFMQSTVFNNIPGSFLDHQQSIPGYDRLFGNLDYVECEPCRSVFGPAAYFVDLMRFIEETITNQNTIPPEHQLDRRRPDLFNLKLDCTNTNELIPYIDLVNQILETIVTNSDHPDARQVLDQANFPSNLPYNEPLEAIRTYLNQLKLNLSDLYQTFETTPLTQAESVTRELLSLSPREFDIIRTELTAPGDVANYYGLNTTQTLDSLATVSIFLEQTGLSRQELTDLIFQSLSQEEVKSGLARQFFINQAEDGLDYLQIEEEAPQPNRFYQVPQERLVNLSLAKLDRIYRFVKLARKLGWSFADLDWALRSIYPNQFQERMLRFDGINDAVTVENATKLNDLTEFTIEAWINPSQAKANPIVYKGIHATEAVVNNAPRTHFLFGLDADNHLVLVSDRNKLQSSIFLPLNQFSYIAVTIAPSQITFYINDQSETQATTAPIVPVGSTVILGSDGGSSSFAGILQEMRIWQGIRQAEAIASDRTRRLTGQEPGLVAYWTLIAESLDEENSNQVSDRTANPNHGILGGSGRMTQPQWVPQGLELGGLPIPLDASYQFNGIDQYLAAREVQGLEINQNTGNELTVEAWVNLANNQGNTIFRIRSVNDTQPEFECGVTGIGNFAILARGSFHQANISVPLNQFTHVAVTIRDKQVQFYVNGQIAGTGTLPDSIVITGSDLEIGRNLSGDHFNGQLREVRVWNQARSAEQIQQMMHRVLPIRAAGLIGYWRLNQIEAGMAKDLSYNQNHLYLGGIPADFMPDRISVDRLLPSPIALTSSVLALDGINDVIVVSNPQNAGLGQLEQLTLELWFRPTNLAARANLQQVIYTQSDAKAGLNAYVFENQVYVLAWCEDDTQQIQETVLRSQPLSDQQWHHLAIVNDTTRSRHFVEFRAYLNGDELGLLSSNHPNATKLENYQQGYLLNRTGVTYLGGVGAGGVTRFQGTTASASPLYSFAGQITDVRLWNRIKSKSEIQQERLVAPDPTDARLLAYLPMTEGQGLIVNDRSSNQNNPSQGVLQIPELVLNGDRIELRNVHSYYNATDALNWTNYVYTGSLSLTDINGAIGVSFLNRNPAKQDQAYLLRRTAQQPTFHLATLPANTELTGDLDSGVNPVINTDYQFRIEVVVSSDQTTIRAKIWQRGTTQPNQWQIEAQDRRGDRPRTGTVGIWADGEGSKFFADLQIEQQFLGEDIGISPKQKLSDWQDTEANFSTTLNDSLFNILTNRNSLFGTESARDHIHSHYAVPDALNWTNYSYSGRLQTTEARGAIGVTFFSHYPENQTRYYRLRAWGQQFTFALETRAAESDPQNGSAFLKGMVDSGISLLDNVWYRFRIEVEDASTQTNIRAKVWREDEPEPSQWQIDAYDDRPNRLKAGTIGVWAATRGSKLYDNLRVSRRTSLLSATPTVIELSQFQIVDAPAPTPWITTDQYPLLFNPLNQRALRFDGRQEYLATALTDDRPLNLSPFTIEAWVKLDNQQFNPVLSWRSAGEQPQTVWFGVNNQGKLTISSRSNVDTSIDVIGNAVVFPGTFNHIAISVAGTTATFYLNGVQDAQVTFPAAIALDATILELGRDGATQYFAGEIQEVRIWKTSRTADQFAPQIRYQQPDAADPDLVAYWSFPEVDGTMTQDASNRALNLRLGGLEAARRPVLIPATNPSAIATPRSTLTLNDATLQSLATIRQLQSRYNLPIDRLTALWFEIRHTGRADGQTLFDRIFNGRGIMGEPWTFSQYPIDWTLTAQNRRSREVRSRLMGTLQISSSDLDLLVQRLSGTTIAIELDNQYLTRLYRLAQLAKVLRLTVQDFLRLLDLINLTDVSTLETFKQVSDRADWMQRTGLQVSELEFLTHSTLNSQISLPYTEAEIRDLATTLTNQSSEFLVTHSSFVSDLVTLAQSMQIFDMLSSAGILDERGAVFLQDQPPVRLAGINGLPTDPVVLQAIQSQVEETLLRMQQEQANAIVERLAELFQVAPERLQIVHSRLGNHLNVTASLFLGWMRDIVNATDSQPLPIAITDYLNQLSRGLYLIDRFTLTTNEAAHLLDNPDDFSVTSVFNPTIADLEHLVMFTELKSAFNDVNEGLIRVFAQAADSAIETAILDVTDWELEQLRTLTNYFGNSSTANRISQLHRLYWAFALADTLQVNIEFPIQLANTQNLTINFYQQQSDALLNVVRSRYDDEQWQRVYKLIRDRLATQKRDALLSYALTRQLPADFPGRRDADVLYEYLLLDVQIGSEVETSRIAQGIDALQLYVQRCQLNLEQGVDPATIPVDQWNWMKNYRVWEANRKVFLYPESYIEPELRDTKTPLFEELEQELMQGEINQANVEKALNNYLNKLVELADLKIVGAYLHREFQELFRVEVSPLDIRALDQNNFLPLQVTQAFAARGVTNITAGRLTKNSTSEWLLTVQRRSYIIRNLNNFLVIYPANTQPTTLYLVGRTTTQPNTYYYRELLVNDRRWLPWQKIDLPLDADFVTPVFAFNRLFLFWVEFNEVSRRIPAASVERTVYQPVVRFSYPDFNGAWVSPQTYAQSYRELEIDEQLRPEWQRVYAVRTFTDIPNPSATDRPQLENRERILIVYGDPNQNTIANVRALRSAREPEEFSLQFNGRAAGNDLNIGLTPEFLGEVSGLFRGTITLFWIQTLNDLVGRSANDGEYSRQRNGLASVLNQPFDAPPSLNVPSNFGVDNVGNNQWFLTYDNTRLLIQQEGNRLGIYLFSRDFLRNALGNLTRRIFSNDLRLTNRGPHHWLVEVDDQRFLLLTRRSGINGEPPRSNVYRLSTARLYSHANPNALSSAHEYGLAVAPIEAPGNSTDFLFERLPLESSFFNINNQQGWYILDTGEEQYLLTANVIEPTTDAERFVISNPAQREFTFQSDPLLELASRFSVERLDTVATQELSLILFREGIDGLLSLPSQQIRERNFFDYGYNSQRITPPRATLVLNGGQSEETYLPDRDTIDFNGSFGLYYQEIFFHIPFFIANQLNANQDFAGAQRWYHYIFNPTSQESVNGATNGATNCPIDQNYLPVLPNRDRYWQYLPFRNRCVDSIARILDNQIPDNQAALAAYRHDPFDPHTIAQLRVNAYQKAIVMKYIDNLLDWGDYLFNQNNRESISEAAQLYILAYNLLGPRPTGQANRRFEDIGDYNTIRQIFNTPPDFLTEFPRNGALPVPQNGNILTTFCVTENTDFVGFWDRVSDRLFKIRHSLTIDGVFRQLDLFQPPLDVRALVAAFASSNRDLSSILADVNRPVPHYRYGYMLDKAKEMTEFVIGLGEKLLEAIQNRDGEQLATLQNTHERTILDLITATRQAELEAVRQEIEALTISKRGIESRQEYYNTLFNEGIGDLELSGAEITDLALVSAAAAAKIIQVAYKAIGSATAFGFGFKIDEMAQSIVSGFDLAGDAFGATGDTLLIGAQLAQKVGEYQRRKGEWEQERTNIAFELQEIDQQIAIANIRLNMAEHELTVHNRIIQQNQEIADFYRRKFSNEQLYNWMISRISGLYFQAYKLAYATAKDAERAFQYEFGDNTQFINFGHWDSLRRGLLAGESLQLDLMRLEKYTIDQDSRYQEIEKIISMRSALPEAFTMLRDTGNCLFKLTEQMFDQDYPGHFFRVIKSIAITVKSPTLTPDRSLNATLIQLNNQALLEPNIDGVLYLMGLDNANQPDATILRSNWRANQQIAISRSRDNGMFGSFDLNFLFDDRYFPFEGTGAVSSWQLEMPQARQLLNSPQNSPNQNSDVDVIIHLKYTSRVDRGRFREQVMAAIPSLPVSAR